MVNENIEGILFNSSTHWFSIRKIDDIWFNLNSTNELPGPEIISDFYLGAFIQGTADAGYTNFLVKNLPILPAINSEMYFNLNDEKKFVPIEDIVEAKDRKKIKDKEKYQEKDNKENVENKNKFEAFKGKGISFHDNDQDGFGYEGNNDLDEETRLAIELSMNEFVGEMEKKVKKEPSADTPNIHTIIFQAEGQSYERRFYPDDTIGVIKYNNYLFIKNKIFFNFNFNFKFKFNFQDMVDYLKIQLKTIRHIEIFEAMPRKIYSDLQLQLKDSKLSKKQYLMAKII